MSKTIATLDCETDPFEKGLLVKSFIWGVYTPDSYEEFYSPEEVVEYLKDKDWIVYAHNGGKFNDFHELKPYINHYEKIMLISGRMAKFKIGKCEFRDSFCILPTALATYKKSDFEYWKLKKEHRKKYWKEIQQYLFDDCRDLYEFVTKFLDEYGNNLTIASSAMKQWKNLGNKVDNTNEKFFERFKPYYAGGRVQCFQSGVIKGDIKVADINSAYPFAMIHDHPAGKRITFQKELPEKRNEIERCFITLTCRSDGIFFHREKTGLGFPSDHEMRTYHITGWEYLTAIELGAISEVNIQTVYTFDRKINFSEYVNYFYDLKAKAKENDDKAQYIFAKLFMNSLYGKFAANPSKYKDCMLVPSNEINEFIKEGYDFAGNINEIAIMEKPLDEFRRVYYNVATSASITGFVRAMLYKAIRSVDEPLYCDTDSIFFKGNHNLNISEKLGDWDIEAECDSLAIAGKKIYSARKLDKKFKVACKGAKLTPSEIFEVASGQSKNYVPEVPTYSFKKGLYFTERKIQKTVAK